MKRYYIFTYCLPVLVMVGLSTPGQGQNVPLFKENGRIQHKGEPLINKHGTSPIIVDWNGDGAKDLIAGFHFQGWIFYYENSGSDAFPAFFTDRVKLRGGRDVIQSGDS
ncbi:MAG: hypothetical protein GF313_15375 [Caldithrix sp.]|nr:hypothetical protein [Caldithrix sp.]